MIGMTGTDNRDKGYGQPEQGVRTFRVLIALAGDNSVGEADGARPVRCVTLVREPLARLKSLYLYARSGGEAWFR